LFTHTHTHFLATGPWRHRDGSRHEDHQGEGEEGGGKRPAHKQDTEVIQTHSSWCFDFSVSPPPHPPPSLYLPLSLFSFSPLSLPFLSWRCPMS